MGKTIIFLVFSILFVSGSTSEIKKIKQVFTTNSWEVQRTRHKFCLKTFQYFPKKNYKILWSIDFLNFKCFKSRGWQCGLFHGWKMLRKLFRRWRLHLRQVRVPRDVQFPSNLSLVYLLSTFRLLWDV